MASTAARVNEWSPPLSLAEGVERLAECGVRQVHVLAWRDLDDPDAGGSEEHADQFMRRWAEHGLDVVHRTSGARGRPEQRTRNGYRVIRRGGRYDVFARTAVAETLNRMGRADALVEIWNGVPWFSPVWFRRPRIVLLHHVHGPMWNQMFPAPIAAAGRALETRFAPPLYRRALTVTGSPGMRDELHHIGLRADRTRVVPYGTDPFFAPAGAKAVQPLVVAAGRLAPVKRFDELIKAMNTTRERVPHARLVVVGEGPERAALEALIDELDARSWVTLAGYVSRDELRDWYRRAWMVASASLAEGWGLVLTEAAACSTPAVATDITGHRASVVDAVTGDLRPLDQLGAAIEAMLIDHDRRASLASAARERSAAMTWDACALGMLSALVEETERWWTQRHGASR